MRNISNNTAFCAVLLLQLVCLALHSPLRPSPASSNQSSSTQDVIPLSQLNSILSLTRLSEECDLYIPLFTPAGLASSPYIEQARQLALLWHHLSLPYCRNGPATDMRRMCNCQPPQCARDLCCVLCVRVVLTALLCLMCLCD